MPIVTETNENPTLSVSALDEHGNRATAAFVSCNIRAGRGFSVNVDMQDEALCAANQPEITAAIDGFVEQCRQSAREKGVVIV